jgi:glycosyltransferase involved in cell wall biosynthesis
MSEGTRGAMDRAINSAMNEDAWPMTSEASGPGDGQGELGDVSFVVIAYNEAANIEACLRSVLGQKGAPIREVIVVDDASGDATAQLVAAVASTDPRVRLVRLPSNSGRGAARAKGVSLASGGLVAMADGDVVLPPGWLEECLAALAHAHAASGRAVPDGDVTYVYRSFGLVPRGRPSTMALTGSNAVFRREVFEKVKFRPELREGEDIALNHDMAAAGLRAVAVPDLRVDHRESKSFVESLRWMYQSGKGAARQFERYRQLRLPDVSFAGLLVAALAGTHLTLKRRRKALGPALPASWLMASSLGHMLACFRLSRGQLARFCLATLVDALMIGSYSAGRFAGHFGRRLGPNCHERA